MCYLDPRPVQNHEYVTILTGPAAFRPRAHATAAYTPFVEKGRPVLQGLLAIDFLAREVSFNLFAPLLSSGFNGGLKQCFLNSGRASKFCFINVVFSIIELCLSSVD